MAGNTQERQPLGEVEFTLETWEKDKPVKKVYVYNFKQLKIKQIEPAIAVGLWREDQLEQNPDNPEEIIRTGGANFRTRILSYIVNEKVDDKIMPFGGDAEADKVYQNFLNYGTAEEYYKAKEVLEDFFTRTGNGNIKLDKPMSAKKASLMQHVLGSLIQQGMTENLTKKSKGRNG